MTVLRCKLCGAPMPLDAYRTAKYCGAQCARGARLRQWAARRRNTASTPSHRAHTRPPPEQRTALLACVVCGAPLPVAAAPNRKTCSAECCNAHRARYVAAWHEAVKADPKRHATALAKERAADRGRRAARKLHALKKVIYDRYRD